jgi:hypothetical protein
MPQHPPVKQVACSCLCKANRLRYVRGRANLTASLCCRRGRMTLPNPPDRHDGEEGLVALWSRCRELAQPIAREQQVSYLQEDLAEAVFVELLTAGPASRRSVERLPSLLRRTAARWRKREQRQRRVAEVQPRVRQPASELPTLCPRLARFAAKFRERCAFLARVRAAACRIAHARSIAGGRSRASRLVA